MQLTPLYLVEELSPTQTIPRVVHDLALRAVAIYSPVTPAQQAAISAVLCACAEDDFSALIDAMDSAAELDIATSYWRDEWVAAREIIGSKYMEVS